ncbi:CatB-related O-acetyltransferase [Vibrio ezurae]|uniref:Acetyltransferase n=1 Tax=Vibrio ezurae NBRC 102218 TaxID=1219080 RepID=U3B532_9VIBR|nr:CatB-related O-acetyltransferase [Vibrio ezurae]GAD80547.1 hypothetical protein VEZ01S_37_01120 [Vibrio ezurae NBRC 102218]
MSRRKLLFSPTKKRHFSKLNIQVPKWSLYKRFIVPKNIVVIEENVAFFQGERLWSMGAFSYSHSKLITHGNLTVGRYTSIANDVEFMGASHPIERFTSSPITYDKGFLGLKHLKTVATPQQPDTTIGNDVWIASNVILKPGIRIGDGAVIAANAVVTSDVEPYSIVGGVPARKIKMRFPEKQVEALMELQWWNYDLHQCLDFAADIKLNEFIAKLSEKKLTGELPLYKPNTFEF